MTVHFVLGPVWLFLAATAALWAFMMTRPVARSGGAYDFGGAIDALVHLVVALFGTLVIWLSYFALRVFVGW